MRLTRVWRCVFAASALSASTAPAALAQVELERPTGGWNASALTDRSEEIAVAYPPALIDRGAQKYRTLIKGRLRKPGSERSHLIVVNGNPMPLYTGEDGAFARPYVFGFGSNSVEVRSPDGRERRRLQFYEASPTRPQARIRVVLAWDDDQAEVDLHVITPDGQHAFWGDGAPSWALPHLRQLLGQLRRRELPLRREHEKARRHHDDHHPGVRGEHPPREA
jgi:uncharacterized protein YfaP (DUF2135 family)